MSALLTGVGLCCAVQVRDGDQSADQSIVKHVEQLMRRLASQQQQQQQEGAGVGMHGAVLVVVSNDRGFRSIMQNFLRAGGVGVMCVSSRSPQEWNAGPDAMDWDVAADDRVQFVRWQQVAAVHVADWLVELAGDSQMP